MIDHAIRTQVLQSDLSLNLYMIANQQEHYRRNLIRTDQNFDYSWTLQLVLYILSTPFWLQWLSISSTFPLDIVPRSKEPLGFFGKCCFETKLSISPFSVNICKLFENGFCRTSPSHFDSSERRNFQFSNDFRLFRFVVLGAKLFNFYHWRSFSNELSTSINDDLIFSRLLLKFTMSKSSPIDWSCLLTGRATTISFPIVDIAAVL